jgi:hypothetical protein
VFNFAQTSLTSGYCHSMNWLEASFREAAMTPDEILRRFKRVFGRDMTKRERVLFLLDLESPEQTQSQPPLPGRTRDA